AVSNQRVEQNFRPITGGGSIGSQSGEGAGVEAIIHGGYLMPFLPEDFSFFLLILGFSSKFIFVFKETQKMKLDKFDLAILKALQQNARASLNEIGAEVGLSSTPCWN